MKMYNIKLNNYHHFIINRYSHLIPFKCDIIHSCFSCVFAHSCQELDYAIVKKKSIESIKI